MTFTKTTLKRMAKTFIQAFLAYLCVNIAVVDFNSDKDVLKQGLIGLGVSALAAGLAAVMNLEKKELEVFEETPTDEFTTEDEK